MTRIGREPTETRPGSSGAESPRRRGRTGPPAVRETWAAEPTWVWGLPLSSFTRGQAADAVMALVGAGGPSFFITANTHYAMLTRETPELREVNRKAAFLLADGAPLVWASSLTASPLPERVAGSDLIFDLCERAAARGLGLYLLGGAPGVAAEAGERLAARYPGLRVVGTDSPPFGEMTPQGNEAVIEKVRRCKPDLLFVAFGQPKGELWLSQNLEALGVPVSVQIGAALDFASGRVRRASGFLQSVGLEWAHRMAVEPARLAPRYARNAWFVLAMLLRGATRRFPPDGGNRGEDG